MTARVEPTSSSTGSSTAPISTGWSASSTTAARPGLAAAAAAARSCPSRRRHGAPAVAGGHPGRVPLALLAPAEWAAGVLDEGSGRFTIGPLTEVVAQQHTWAELAPLLEPVHGRPSSPTSGRCAARPSTTARSPRSPMCSACPTASAAGSPTTCWPMYHDAGAEFPSPPPPAALVDVDGPPGADPEVLDDPTVELAVRQLVEPWTTSSNGHAELVAVEGDAAAALRALGVTTARRRRPRRRGGHRLAGVGGGERRRPRPAAWRGGGPVRGAVAARRARRRRRRVAAPPRRARRHRRRAALELVGRPRAGHRVAAAVDRRGAGRGTRLGDQRPGRRVTARTNIYPPAPMSRSSPDP